MKSLKRFALIILLILTAVCISVGISACRNEGGNEDVNGINSYIFFASAKDCPNGNIQKEFLKSTMDFKINETYYIVIDYTYSAEQDSEVSDSISAKISLSPAANVSATLEETASGNFKEEVTDDEMNINISYRAPEKAGDEKRIYIVVRFIPLKSELTYIGTSIYLKSDYEKSLVSSGITIFDDYVDGIKLSLNSADSSYYVDGIDSKEREKVIIPSTYKNLSVTYIGYAAFENCEKLRSIYIPDSITSIGSNVFYECSGLTSMSVPDSVTSIGDSAFYGCSGLKNVMVGNSVTSIGPNAFNGCSGLTSITLPDSVTSIGDSAFYDTYYYNNDDNWESEVLYISNHLIKAKSSISGSLEIRDGAITIGDSAFDSCDLLTGITLPDSVTNIGNKVFYSCSGLTSISVNKNNAKYYGEGNCLIERGTKTLLLGCKNSRIPKDATGIGDGAFYGCNGLSSITVPNKVTGIGDSAFYDCSGLTSVTIPDSVTSIGYYAFHGCNNIKYNEYENAYYLGNENNPYAVLINVINKDATNFSFNPNTKIIYCYAFNGCSGLTSISLPDNVTSIGSFAFSGCSKLTGIFLNDGVTSIGNYAFWWCRNLVYIYIPTSVTSIGGYAFKDCSKMALIIYGGTAAEWKIENIFVGNPNLTNVTFCFYSETKPTGSGNYWHYVDGKMTNW